MPIIMANVTTQTAAHRRKIPAWGVLCLLIAAVGFWALFGGLPARALPSDLVTPYLAANVVRPESGGHVFCAYDSLGARLQGAGADDAVTEYVYATCQEYYVDTGRLRLGAGARQPAVVTARRTPAGYVMTDYLEALDGAGNRDLFPPLVLWKIRRLERTANTLNPAAQAKAYFGL